ncbi:MAG: HAD family hydrolase [Acidobacteria bacterium]|nr:HAD family hydrolase [Acidobacteriota bacterium]
MDRALISDIDNTLIGDPAALDRLLRRLAGSEVHVCFGIATGRHLEITLEVLEEWGVPLPDVLVTAVGTEIYYGPHLQPDSGWSEQIARQWEPDKIREVLAEMSDLRLQAPKNQRSFKISYVISPDKSGCVRQVEKLLPKRGLFAKAVFSHGRFLDILPADAGKGAAIRYLAGRWHWPPEHILVAGDSGNDADMLQGGYRGVAVGNHSPELEWLRGKPRVFFAPGKYAAGICDGLDYYGFLNAEYRKPGGR